MTTTVLVADDQAIVRDGLAPGTQVIAYPGDRVADGVKVKARASAPKRAT